MNHKLLTFLRFLLVIAALGVASFLAFFSSASRGVDHKIVFVLDINRTMNTQDVLSGSTYISRLQAAKNIITKTISSEPDISYGLVLFNAWADYILPPSFDTWTFFLYLSGINTNLLPDWSKDFVHLGSFLKTDEATSYLLLSDFDTIYTDKVQLPRSTILLGLGSSVGEKVRYANGIIYYDNGKSVVSARNDQFANTLGLPYISLSDISSFSHQKSLFHGIITLSTIQYLWTYMLLWVLVVLAVLF